MEVTEKCDVYSFGVLTLEILFESTPGDIAYLFSEKFLISDHPLSGHIRATLRKKGDRSL
jgi:hypothetical protein